MKFRRRSSAMMSTMGALLLIALLAGVLVSFSTFEGGSTVGGRFLVVQESTRTEPTPCPIPTPEWLRVAPLTSPTEAFSQIIWVTLGNGEFITVTANPGTFTAPYSSHPSGVPVHLVPDHIHYLEVEARVAVTNPECHYGGYTLRTSVDLNGDPLLIEQHNSSVAPILYLPIISSP